MTYDAFISYANQQKAKASALSEALKQRGLKPYFSSADDRAGSDWTKHLSSTIENSTTFVVLVTIDAMEEGCWVLKELKFACEKNKPIIPIRLDNAELPEDIKFELPRIQYIVADGRSDPEWIEIVDKEIYANSVVSPTSILRTNIWKRPAELLNRRFRNECVLHSVTDMEPAMVSEGKLSIEKKIKFQADELKPSLKENSSHAVLTEKTIWSDGRVTFNFKETDYAVVKVMQDHGQRPRVITGNTIATCSERGEVFLLRRSMTKVDYYPGGLHIFGGNYEHEKKRDNGSLKKTAQRELSEEAQIFKQIEYDTLFLLSEESNTGYIQFIVLGLDIEDRHADMIHGSEEGEVVRVLFDKLGDEILNDDKIWVTSGKMALLAWLALGAPCTGAGQGFDGRHAIEMFNTWRDASILDKSRN